MSGPVMSMREGSMETSQQLPLRADARDGRGRDEDCSPPPAQIRTCGFPAYGSYLG
jgi:hypothetical protein